MYGVEADVSASGGDCAADISGAYCASAAYGGPAGFCNLQRIGDVGAWLKGVGAYYCSE